jgi:hypothetical protein
LPLPDWTDPPAKHDHCDDPSLARNFVIDVPPKIWRPKPVDRHTPLDHGDDVDGNIFEFEQRGETFCHPAKPFIIQQDDIHLWDCARDFIEFEKNFVIGVDVNPDVKAPIVGIVKDHWDCFYEAGAKKPILHFEFAIDAGGSPPVCCKKPRHGPHESKITNDITQNSLMI